MDEQGVESGESAPATERADHPWEGDEGGHNCVICVGRDDTLRMCWPECHGPYARTRIEATTRLRQDGYAIITAQQWDAVLQALHANGVKFHLRERTEQEIRDAHEHNARLGMPVTDRDSLLPRDTDREQPKSETFGSSPSRTVNVEVPRSDGSTDTYVVRRQEAPDA